MQLTNMFLITGCGDYGADGKGVSVDHLVIPGMLTTSILSISLSLNIFF